jgi:hypothetical protein
MISERRLAARLHDGFLEAGENVARRDEALTLAGAALRERVAATDPVDAAASEPARQRPSRRFGLRPVLLTLLLTLVVLTAATPTGRSIASDVAEFVGIGDEPTEEPVFEEPDEAVQDVVIGVGESPSGAAYEVVAEAITDADGRESVCFTVSFPDYEPRGSLQCLTAAADRSVGPDSLVPVSYIGADGSVVVAGIAGPDVASLAISAPDGQPAEASLHPVAPDLAASIQTDLEAGYFVAFPAAEAESVTLTAYDDAGSEVATEQVSVPPAEAAADSPSP